MKVGGTVRVTDRLRTRVTIASMRVRAGASMAARSHELAASYDQAEGRGEQGRWHLCLEST